MSGLGSTRAGRLRASALSQSRDLERAEPEHLANMLDAPPVWKLMPVGTRVVHDLKGEGSITKITADGT